MKKILLAVAILLLLAAEITRVYFIMPFPGSQRSQSLSFAYWIHNNLLWIRLLLLFIIGYLLSASFKKIAVFGKILIVLALLFYVVVYYFFNFKFQADKMFVQPKQKIFATAAENKVDNKKLVIGLTINGESKAYPVQVIGYHHQVRDTVGNVPVMVTYCTVCRTGRIFDPHVNGKNENFRLVGMDHFNAMFEDETTHSWWQQATGEAVAGKLKGTSLKQIPSEQSTLGNWLALHPTSLILQPDTIFNKQYASLDKFDDGTTKDKLEKRDSASWQFKSWIIGVEYYGQARAYDWNRLVKEKIINDSIGKLPVLITMAKDTATFYVLNRSRDNEHLFFNSINDSLVKDGTTGSLWNLAGYCIDGPLKGRYLAPVQSSQEFWHSWKTFHPTTTTY